MTSQRLLRSIGTIVAAFGACASGAVAGPYSDARNDPTNSFDAPIPGFVGPNGAGKARLPQSDGTFVNPDNFPNPIFVGWASGFSDYQPAPGVAGIWQLPEQALGPVTGDSFHIVSLGDLSVPQITAGILPGRLTLSFPAPIRNKTGADFAIFENGLISAGGTGVAGQIFAELAFVEVSSDGIHFARMPSRSLTPGLVGPFGTLLASNVFALAGKHANAAGESWGTPFDLSWLADHPLVIDGKVNPGAITHVRIVDLPGNGAFLDSEGDPIFEPWQTIGSGGFDLEAVGVISQDIDFEMWLTQRGLNGPSRGANQDPDGDGLVNLLEYSAGLLPDSPDTPGTHQRFDLQEGRLVLEFLRDERTADLVLEVESSSDLANWQVIARSTAGGPVVPVAPHTPAVSERPAAGIASIGVLRSVRVSEDLSDATPRFLRLRVTRILP